MVIQIHAVLPPQIIDDFHHGGVAGALFQQTDPGGYAGHAAASSAVVADIGDVL
jgi:hypothetical protein